MNELTVGQLAEKVDLKPSAIRYYEQVGLLPPAKRINGQRRYTETIVPQIRFVKLTQNVGFSIEEILILLEEFGMDTPPSSQWRFMATRKLEEMDEQIKRIEWMKSILQKGLQCQCLSWDECLGHLTPERRG